MLLAESPFNMDSFLKNMITDVAYILNPMFKGKFST